MEAKESEILEAEELKNLVECCICTNNFNDPRLLPCSHTFCLKCLENVGEKFSKLPGNAMACPLCSREFSIPTEGFSGLQRNLFVDKLMKMSGMVGSLSSGIQCDVCLEERSSDTENATPHADMHCEECEQNLCQDCCKQHSRFRGTKLHKLIDVGEHSKGKVYSGKPIQSMCVLHGRVTLKIFCFDCKTVLCAVCFIETHQTHKGTEVNKVAEDFRKQIKEMAFELGQRESDVEEKCSKLNQKKTESFQTLVNLEKEMTQHYEQIKETGDKQLKLLLLKLENMRQTKLKEVADIKENLEKHTKNLVKHKGYCNDIAAAGSDVDVCQGLNILFEKVTELKEQHDNIIRREVPPLAVVFEKSSLYGIFGLGETDMIGTFSAEFDEVIFG